MPARWLVQPCCDSCLFFQFLCCSRANRNAPYQSRVPVPVGGRQKAIRPAESGGPHPKDRNEEKDLKRERRLREAAAGLKGDADQPPRPRKG